MALLALSDIQKRFRKLEVLRGASLSVEPGEIVGLTGENGSGKSTLLNIAVGLLAPDGGEIRLEGSRGFCPQEPVLYQSLSMEENIAYFAAGYGLEANYAKTRSAELIERLGTRHHTGKRVSSLSGGTKQKVNLIISLLHDPDVVILDEPYQGFDYESYIAFWDLAAELKRPARAPWSLAT
jgi:ABC-2 type transport system ATP-binding protein